MADYNNRTNFNTRSNPSDNTNTNGIMLKNHDKHKFLACSHWNKGVVIEIAVCKIKSRASEGHRYNIYGQKRQCPSSDLFNRQKDISRPHRGKDTQIHNRIEVYAGGKIHKKFIKQIK